MKLSPHGQAALALAAGWLVLSWPWLSGQVTIPYDAKAHFQAQVQFLATALHTGQSPFWTPHIFGGSPQIADPQSLIFSPAIILAALDAVPSFRQMDGYVLLLLLIGAVAVVMFFKDRGWHPVGAVVAGLTFAFGGSAAWRIQHINQIQSYALFAVCLLFLSRALVRRSLANGLMAGFVAALMIAEPGQVGLLGCYTLLIYAMAFFLAQPQPMGAVRKALVPLSGGALVCILIAGVPVALSYLFVEASSRPEIAFGEAAKGSLAPASLLTSVIADLFGAFDPSVPYWGPSSWEWGGDTMLAQNMTQCYFGIVPILVVLAFGLWRGVLFAREIRVFTLLAAGFLLYSLGYYTPLFKFLYECVPGVDLFRRPADATFMLGAALSILSGYVVHRICADQMPAWKRWQIAAGAGLFVAVMIVGAGTALAMGKLSEAAKPIAWAAGLLVCGAALLSALPRLTRHGQALAIAVVCAFMVFDLSINNGPNESTALLPEEYDVLNPETKNTTIALIKSKLKHDRLSPRRDRVELVGLGFEWPNASMVHGFDNLFGYNPLRLADVSEALAAGDTLAEPSQRHFSKLFPSYRSRMADMLGLRYVVSGVPIEQIDKSLKRGDLTLIARTADAYVYENPNAFPRVFFAPGWQNASFAAIAKTGEWPAFEPKKTVLFDCSIECPPPLKGKSPIYSVALTDTTLLRGYQNTQIEIEVFASQPGFVVLNDAWHPWWYATVDGADAEVYRANVLFRAVAVPAGRHVVRFEFKPFEGAIASFEEKLFEKHAAAASEAEKPKSASGPLGAL